MSSKIIIQNVQKPWKDELCDLEKTKKQINRVIKNKNNIFTLLKFTKSRKYKKMNLTALASQQPYISVQLKYNMIILFSKEIASIMSQTLGV